MTYHSQLNLIMLVTVIGLAVFLYLKPQFQSENGETLQISIRTPETVQMIRIIRQGQEITLERTASSGWHMVAPFSARADEELVGKMLNVLSAHSRQRFPLRDTESFNLDHPVIELYIDDDHFAFGGLAPVTNEQYLAINEHVYLVSPRYAIWVPASPMDLVSPRLLADDDIPVRFELDDLTVNKQNDVWHVDSEVIGSLNNQLLARWAENWRFIQATELLTDLRDYSDKQFTVKISFLDGREMILNVIDNESGTVFYRPGEQVAYFFPHPIARQLLDPSIIEPE
ncbi:MAG: DUF4340 domain-containing protein [Burkholderiales bacterium]|nr:DUF4340 domain-containing protein [Nitrosomonas sp.]MCP5275292.1 DUF4340 domain-containing protein [Burkholderiales bacterium]